MFRLGICTETVYRDLPLRERARRIAAQGFFVDLWWVHDRDLTWLAEEPQVRIGSITGYAPASLVDPGDAERFWEGALAVVRRAKALGCRDLVLHAGLDEGGRPILPPGLHPATLWTQLYKNLCRLAELAEREGVVYHLEHLNAKVDHPGYPLARVEDAIRVLEAVGSPRIRLLLDLYHAQVEEGNLVALIRRAAPYLGYVHVADVPGRHEPGTGEIAWPRIVEALAEVGYRGPVSLEAFPKGEDERALEAFRVVFAGR